MAHYWVSDADGSRRVTLVDAIGRQHVARALHDELPVGAELHGPRPMPGFAILADASTQRLCRVIFEQVDCGDTAAGRRQQ